MRVEFIASVSVITPEPASSRRLYVDALGLPLRQLDGDYYGTEQVDGSKHFGVWPLAQAAQACFGTPEWLTDTPVPQVSLEFEVEDVDAVAAAAQELQAHGHALLHPAPTG